MKKVTVGADTKKAVIETLGESAEIEYEVKSGAELTLVLVGKNYTQSHAHVRVRLVGFGAKATIVGVVAAPAASKLTLSTVQQHEAPDTTSDLLVRSVLSDNSACIYDGAIRVEKLAQKTDAYQRNENILLSPSASAESKPSLEILANDVRCTHGATVGPISTDQLWYLATRGIGVDAGTALVQRGFLLGALERVDDESVRNRACEMLGIAYTLV